MKGCETHQEGFVLPVVIFTMAILALLAVTALTTANDEYRSSRAMRESGVAMYAAEAGAHMIFGTVVDTSSNTVLDTLAGTLAPGDSVDLGWSTLPSGASYRGVFHRYDNGGQAMYVLAVTGHGAGLWGGQRLVSLALTAAVPGGLVVDGAVGVVGGILNVGSGGGVVVDGNDNVPPGWAGACDPPGAAMPGIATPDATTVTQSGGPTIDGTPPILEDPSLSVSDFDTMWDQLFALVNKIYLPGEAPVNIGPVENPPGTCDTSVLDNWGAPTDPAHPCFNYFPIIFLENGRLKSNNGQSGQGILLVGCAGSKCDLEIENGFSFYGLILVQGEFELETGSGADPAHVYGSVMVKNYGDPTKASKIGTGSTLQYSSCAMKRVTDAAGLGGSGGLQPLASRAWSAPLR